MKKTAALKYDVWKYCDPTINRAELSQLIEPIRPKPADVRASLSEGSALVTFASLTPDERERYRIEIEDYARERKKYNRQIEALVDL